MGDVIGHQVVQSYHHWHLWGEERRERGEKITEKRDHSEVKREGGMRKKGKENKENCFACKDLRGGSKRNRGGL